MIHLQCVQRKITYSYNKVGYNEIFSESIKIKIFKTRVSFTYYNFRYHNIISTIIVCYRISVKVKNYFCKNDIKVPNRYFLSVII